LVAATTALASCLAAAPAAAQTTATWNPPVGVFSGDFSVDSNWSSGAVPGPLDTAIVNSGFARILSTTAIGALQMSPAPSSIVSIENGAPLTIGSAAATTISGNATVSIQSGRIEGTGIIGVGSGGNIVLGNISISSYGVTENQIAVNGGGLRVDAGQAWFATLNNGSAVNSENGRIEIITVNGGLFINNGAGLSIPLPAGNLNAGVGVINQTGGTTTNNGRVTERANVSGGDFRNNTGATVLGAVTQSGGDFDNSGTVAGATSLSGGTFTHRTGAAIAGLTVTGGTFQNLAGASIAGATQSGGSFINSGAVTGAFALAGGLLDNRAYGTIGTLTVTGGTLVSGSALSFDGGAMVADVTFDGDGAATQGAAFTGSDGRSIVKTGSGTLMLTAANLYTGGTRLEAGALDVRHSAALGSGAVTILGGRMDLADGLAIGNVFDLRNTLQLGVASGADVVMSGAIGETAGSHGIALTGGGRLTLTGGNTTSGSTLVDTGTLRVAADGNFGTGSLVLQNAGRLVTTASFGSMRAVTLGIGGGVLEQAAGTTLTANGTIAGAGALTKAGTGTLVLTGSNSYAGTVITAGTLQVGFGGSTGTLGTGTVLNDGTLAFARSDTTTVANTISGAGAVVQMGSGTLVLTGVNTHSGGTRIEAGTIGVSGDASLGSGAGPLTLRDGGRLLTTATFTSGRAVTLGPGGGVFHQDTGTTLSLQGAVAGVGSLTKEGGGTLVLDANNTFTGGSTVAGGTLRVDGGLGGALTVLADARLQGVGTIAGSTLRDNGLTVAPMADPVVVVTNVAGQVNIRGTTPSSTRGWPMAPTMSPCDWSATTSPSPVSRPRRTRRRRQAGSKA
jgi:autotransporter-associated beta strand protein